MQNVCLAANVSEVLICKTKPAHSECQWGLCAPLSFPFPAVIWLISVFRCSRKRHLFGNTFFIKFSWGDISLETALRCHSLHAAKRQSWPPSNNAFGYLAWETTSMDKSSQKSDCITNEWLQTELQNFPIQLCVPGWTNMCFDSDVGYCMIKNNQSCSSSILFRLSNWFNEFQSYIMHAFNTGHFLGTVS